MATTVKKDSKTKIQRLSLKKGQAQLQMGIENGKPIFRVVNQKGKTEEALVTSGFLKRFLHDVEMAL